MTVSETSVYETALFSVSVFLLVKLQRTAPKEKLFAAVLGSTEEGNSRAFSQEASSRESQKKENRIKEKLSQEAKVLFIFITEEGDSRNVLN